MGNWVADVVSEKIGTKCTIKNINPGLLNRLIIDDLKVKDQNGKEILKVARLSVSINLLKLAKGKIDISSAQLFTPRGYIYKDVRRKKMNYEFIVDAFKSQEEGEKKPINLRINSLIVRHMDFRYEDSLHIEDMGFNLSLKTFTQDSLNLAVSRMSGSEKFKGIGIKNLQFNLIVDSVAASLYKFNLTTRHSTVNIDTISIELNSLKNRQTPQFSPFCLTAQVVPAEFSVFVPALKNAHTPLHLRINAESCRDSIMITDLRFNDYMESLVLNASAKIVLDSMRISHAHTDINDLNISQWAIHNLLGDYGVDTARISPLMQLDNICLTGHADHTQNKTDIDGNLYTSAGNLSIKGSLSHPNNIFNVALSANNVYVGKLLKNKEFGIANLSIKASGNPDRIFKSQIVANLKGGNLEFDMESEISGSSIDDVLGYANIDNLTFINKNDTTRLTNIKALSSKIMGENYYSLSTDFCNIELQGIVTPSHLPNAVLGMVSPHIPTLLKGKKMEYAGNNKIQDFKYSVSVWDASNLKAFLHEDIEVVQPIYVTGDISSIDHTISLFLNAPDLTIKDKKYENIVIDCNSSVDELSVSANATQGTSLVNLYAAAANDSISSNIDLQVEGKTPLKLKLNSIASFADSTGNLFTRLAINDNSSLVIKDTTWVFSPALISVLKGNVTIDNLTINNDNCFLSINGGTNKETNDSIVVTLGNIDLAYILSAVNFKAVKFDGRASGRAVINNPMGKSLAFNANLNVKNFCFNNGLMGEAEIRGTWDDVKKQVNLDAHIVDAPLYNGEESFTDVHGYVSPPNDDILLHITAHNTRTEFLNDFVDGFMHKTKGHILGNIDVVGPISCVGLEGEADATIDIALKATNIPYHLEKQHLTFEKECLHFDNLTITDRFGNTGEVNGRVTHRNFSDFGFEFDVDFHHMLAYEEKEFNSDKFLATIFTNGKLQLRGHDGAPLRITANLTPTKGSVFAYDTATPDAITSNSFVTFRDPTKRDSENTKTAEDNYHGDLYVDFNVNLNPDCDIKLRMDNKDDGFITTRGYANLQAKYYNKGSLQLFGTYNITSGDYRLYLQDLIFKDLAIQTGSSVEFNGAPFDANIHLICHHTINGVPITDLTGTTTFSQSYKVKVICKLDITGKIDNMNFGFNLEVPNVNDEIKQLVRASISTEEEMNTQMVYLLGFGRFYPTSYARTTTQDASSNAVNSLVSSTLSGQLNNMISKMVGPNSKWSFGANISTGEKGWQDIDAEGTLSGRLFNDRLLINGNFGYRDNALTNRGMVIGDFEVKWRLLKNSNNIFLRAYNMTNDRYFTKATLNTQGIGISFQHDFESWKKIFKK